MPLKCPLTCALFLIIQDSFRLLPVCKQGLNWADLAQKKMPSPFKPELKSELDVGNFAEEFTGMDPVYSPASTPPSTGRLFKVSPFCLSQDPFKALFHLTITAF